MMSQINCPEGRIELPIDIWYCKLIDKPCPIQASIDTDDWAMFEEHCLAAPERQTGIRGAITNGEYGGFHHLPGRYLCPTCKPSRGGRWDRAYHYREDLMPLQPFVSHDDRTLRIAMMKQKIPLEALAGALCRSCIDDVLERLELPSVAEQRERRSGYGEPMNEDQPVQFNLFRSIRERVGGAELPSGSCGWCERGYAWNSDGDCVYYDAHSVKIAAGEVDGFRLCETCGEKLAALLEVPD